MDLSTDRHNTETGGALRARRRERRARRRLAAAPAAWLCVGASGCATLTWKQYDGSPTEAGVVPVAIAAAPKATPRPARTEEIELPPLPDAAARTAAATTNPAPAKVGAQAIALTVVDEPSATAAKTDDGVEPVSCASCGRVHLPPVPGTPLDSACDGAGCKPGQAACDPLQAHTFAGRFIAELYNSLACPDPCYEPRWIPEANAAFFVDYARPRTIQRLGFDWAWDVLTPDRNEYFWARADGKGLGPALPKVPAGYHPANFSPLINVRPGTTTSSGSAGYAVHVPNVAARPPGLIAPPGLSGSPHVTHVSAHSATTSTALPTHQIVTTPNLSYQQLSFYNEIAADNASIFFAFPYMAVQPLAGPAASGFGDMQLGGKTLIYDRELLQVALQFKSFMPVGNSRSGLGTGHFSLEPALLTSLRLAPEAYLQGMLAEWIPLGGDPGYAGSILHYHLSANQTIWKLTRDSPLIATFEFNGWSFQGGSYTSPFNGPYQHSAGQSYLSLGPGLRMVLADKVDFGVGSAFAITDPHWANQLVRFELRILY